MSSIGKFIIPVALLMAVTAQTAHATKRVMEENDAIAAVQAKIPLIQAITTAERHVGGKATRAVYEMERNEGVYDVEVVNGVKVFDVTVDAGTGAVVSSALDRPDGDDDDGDHGHE